MLSTHSSSSHGGKFQLAALITGLFVGFTGLLPHLRWSIERDQCTWFFNSYDEGFYGWLSVSSFSANRILSDAVMHLLNGLTGGNTQTTMILADFLFPMGVACAACYLVRPLFARPVGMVAGALFLLVSAECFALRSTAIPHSGIYDYLSGLISSGSQWMNEIIQIGNLTSTFWLFRTPEPQITWIPMFITLGLVLRLLIPNFTGPKHLSLLLAVSVLLTGMGYLFCALTLGGSLILAALTTVKANRKAALIMGASGLLCLISSMGFSLYAASQSGGGGLVFPSRQPVVMISAAGGLVAVGIILLRHRRNLPPLQLFAIALGLAPTFLANQQIITGRLIYLLNFENFALAQISALSLLIAVSPSSRIVSATPGRTLPHQVIHRALVSFALVSSLFFGGILLRSQTLGYDQYLEENREAWSYAEAIRVLPTGDHDVACDNFFQTDTLALRLGYHPGFVVSRDITFSAPVDRLRHEKDIPSNSTRTRHALYHYLALTGTSPEELGRRFDAIHNPENPNWQDRFMLGAFLYNYADFWAPLTHGRDTKLGWIKNQKNLIVEDYSQFIQHQLITTKPVIYIMRQDQPDPQFPSNLQSRKLDINFSALPIPMKAFRISEL